MDLRVVNESIAVSPQIAPEDMGAIKAAGYVAIDQVHGTLEGRTGGFLLLHRGTIDPAGKADLSVIISPGSGTGALAGIAGTFSIEMKEGKHFYDLAYTLPDKS